MALQSGDRLGPYEIVAKIGEGGMGQVYKARDTRLDRTVAVKVLPADLAMDPATRSRFEREARALAALSHPHICTVHDVGRDNDTDYLVMEFLDGESLAERVTRTGGALPLEQVLPIGSAIADALDKAHRAGIVHRDLKPANVMLTKTGPKLVDFGLAKAMAALAPAGPDTRTIALTGAHTIVGTIHYMSPEQVEGREADARSDIWALGAVLYEAATGQRPFTGESPASVMSAILKDAVPLVSTRRSLTPPAFDHLVDRCLQKDPDARWQDAGDVKRQLQWMANTSAASLTAAVPAPSAGTHAAAPTTRGSRGWALAASALVAGLAIGAAAMWLRPPTAPPSAPRTVLSIAPPEHVVPGHSFALSPDGRHFAFVGLAGDGPATLWRRSLDTGAAQQLQGTEDASYPFWAPDGSAIGFFAGGKLKTVAITGGLPRTLTPVDNGRGGTWGEDGTIVYAAQTSALFRIPATGGGVPAAATTLEAQRAISGHRWPTFVGPRHFVYTVQAGGDATGLYLASLDAPGSTKLSGVYSNTLFVDGRLLFVHEGMLVEQTLDITAGKLVGGTREIAGPLAFVSGLGYTPISISQTGTLAYATGSGSTSSSALVWFDRRGTRLGPLGGDIAGRDRDVAYGQRLSPDGRTLVMPVFRTASADLWLFDLTRLVASRFTFDTGNDQNPVFSPDGTEVLFISNRQGPFNLFRKRVGGSSDETRLLESPTPNHATDWSAHGPTIFFTNLDPRTKADIWMLPLGGNAVPALLVTTEFNEYAARLSPDGEWLAYTSDESGRPEVYVQKFPAATRKWQISSQGGVEPAWRRDGRELFFIAANQTLNAVAVSEQNGDFSAGPPVKLFGAVIDTSLGSVHTTHYTPTADAQRFLVNVSALSETLPTVVLNWTSGLKESGGK